jgi:hypothetical protein
VAAARFASDHWFRTDQQEALMDPDARHESHRRPGRHDYRRLINRQLPFEERTCGSKVRFDTRAQARQLANDGRRSDGRLRPYQCPFGSHWHLGHAHRRRSTAPASGSDGRRDLRPRGRLGAIKERAISWTNWRVGLEALAWQMA